MWVRLLVLTCLAAALNVPFGHVQATERSNERSPAAAGTLLRDGRADCSAVLIRSDMVLTAAHCVAGLTLTGDGGENTLAFRPGVRAGLSGEPVEATRIMPHPLFRAAGGFSTASRSADIALVALERPVPDEIADPIPPSNGLVSGEQVIVASYPGGNGGDAIARDCSVIDADDTLARIGCTVVRGESGGPVLRMTPDGPVLAAIIVAAGQDGEVSYALAVQVASRLGQIFAVYGDGTP